MKNSLKSVETPYIDAQTLLLLLADYKRPREAILRMVKKGGVDPAEKWLLSDQ